jgi:predicted amidohydrolase YtcJ
MTLVLAGARLPGSPGVVDVTIRGGLIAGIEPSGRPIGPDAERIDLDGRWLLPGLWDQHVHFTQWAQTARRLDVSQATSPAEAAALVRSRAEADPGTDVLVGFGFHDALWRSRPTRELLDVAAGDRPVVLIAGDLHCSWLNTAAFERFAPGVEGALLREDESSR